MTQAQTSLAVRRLPDPRNAGAELVVKAADKIANALTAMPERDRAAFTYALVVAANETDLSQCSPMSVLMCAYNAARLGLPPGKAQGLCYFIPFKQKNSEKKEATLIVGFRGWIDLAARNNFLRSIVVDVVTKEEVDAGDFVHWRDETGDRIKHKPHLDREPTRQNIVAAYVIAQLAHGQRQVKIVPISKILKVAKDTDPWKYAFDEMACKTAVHRASKLWRLTPQLALASALEDAAETETSQAIDIGDDLGNGNGKKGFKLGSEEPKGADGETLRERYARVHPNAGTVAFEAWAGNVSGGEIDEGRCHTVLDEIEGA